MTVAILCPTHNRANTLPDMVDSCLRQTDPDWRLVVLNDGSTDATRDVYVRYRSDGRIMYHEFKKCPTNEPGVRNRLLGLWEEIQTPLACWLDSDDIMHPDRIKVQREFMQAYPHLDISFTALGWFTDETIEQARRGEFLEPFSKPEPSAYGKSLEGYRGNLTFPTAMFRPRVREVRWFEPMIHGGADLLWLFTLVNSGYWVGAVPQQLYYLRNHPGRLTNRRKQLPREVIDADLAVFRGEVARLGGVP